MSSISTGTFAFLLGLTNDLPPPSTVANPMIYWYDDQGQKIQISYPVDEQGVPKPPSEVMVTFVRDNESRRCKCIHYNIINCFMAPPHSQNPSHRGKYLLQCPRAAGHRCGYVICLNDLYIEAQVAAGIPPPCASPSLVLSSSSSSALSTPSPPTSVKNGKRKREETIKTKGSRGEGSSSLLSKKPRIKASPNVKGEGSSLSSSEKPRNTETPSDEKIWWCEACQLCVVDTDKHWDICDEVLVDTK